jgi:hypothetical protein
LQRDVWVTTWNNDGAAANAKNIPNDFQAFMEWLEEWIAQEITSSWFWRLLPGEYQAKLMGFFVLSQMTNVKASAPSSIAITLTVEVTQVTNGLHFRRGIQNMRRLDMEWELPIPPVKGSTTQRDSAITQKAWWDAILAIDCDRKTVHVALELRITGGSNIILAPQRGNDLGTFSIEVLSTLATPEDDWHAFCQSLAN